ncbi:MAG: hypothetical protein OdinLCB4_004595 [Candidatus Odinarchaeum yellowstonii]|uniref:DNA-binding protein MutS2 n=1 Tax=Odinarchaeota yellowstonii (strain LCB_4) TaxID=1841599 RepID=A0AAF0D137_ODILC|nr:MAG: hypothetical protein OdinLCB4_004595 [Candidatus Odinarchaeum yellowstonii]
MEAEKFNDLYGEFYTKIGGDGEAKLAALKLDSLTMFEKTGLNSADSLRIVNKILQEDLKLDVKTVLKTDDAKKIYASIISLIEDCFSTNYSKNKIKLFYPLPSQYIEAIKERQAYAAAAKKTVEYIAEPDKNWFKSMLSKISPLKKPKNVIRIPGRVIITDDKKIFEKYISQSLNEFCDLFYIPIKEREQLIDYLQNYESVLYVSDSSYYPSELEYAENVEILSSSTPISELIPEKVISFFAANYNSVKAACEIVLKWFTLNLEYLNKFFSSKFSENEIRELTETLICLDEAGGIKPGLDPDIDNLSKALTNIDKIIVQVETELNEYIKRKVSSSAVTIKGEQILKILQSAYNEVDAEKIKQYLPEEVIEIFEKAIQLGEEAIIKKLSLPQSEAFLVDGILPREIKLPLEANRRKISELESNLRAKLNSKKYKLLKNISKKLEKHFSTMSRLIAYVQEFDFFLGLGEFALKYGLNPPSITTESTGIGFEKGVNLFLKDQELKGRLKVEPIDYNIGSTPLSGDHEEHIIILTGANSGGKSMCIELIAQTSILTQMGLLTPAQIAYTSLFDEIHFFAKTRGMLTAGALEESLKKFAKITSSNVSKLVLFDEVEAMTESGAAAKILAAVLDMLSENPKTCAVMVTHLGGEIIKLAKSAVRVDGIEAEGLDDKMNLIVNRKPRYNYLARSTPELIVERLFRLAKGDERKVYERILREFSKEIST